MGQYRERNMTEENLNQIAKGLGPGAQNAQKSGYEKIYDWVVESLADFDLQANAEPLGLKCHPEGGVVVSLFGRDYHVNNSGAKALDGLRASFNHLSLVAHYAMSRGRSPASGDFMKLSALSGIPAGTASGGYDRNALSMPLIKRFGHDPEALEAAVLRLGGRRDPKIGGQTREYLFDAFPRIVLKLIFEEPDEEFGPDFHIMFDSKSIEYMEFEALGFLGGILITDLLRQQDVS
jgi:hypothetical protein